MRRSILFLGAFFGLIASAALAQDRYVVGYATRLSEGPALTVISDVAIDPDQSSDESLRNHFITRLGGREKDFSADIAIFDRRDDADQFKRELLDRAGATGAVEELPMSISEKSVGLWRQHATSFDTWPFSAADAKRRQLLASEVWNLPVTMTAAGRDFVLIPPGEFVMGSPESEAGRDADEVQHRVRITAPYYLARDDERFEVEGWGDTLGEIFASAPEGYRFRFPTEAEWEYAARAGIEGANYSADGTIPGEYGDPVSSLSWNARKFHRWESEIKTRALAKGGTFLRFYASCVIGTALRNDDPPVPANPMQCRGFSMSLDDVLGEGLEQLVELDHKPGPKPGRRFAPNAWGLYDMLGRYDEVVADSYLPYSTDEITVNPRQQKDLTYAVGTLDLDLPGKGFIMRGGHFADGAREMRVARRRQVGYTFLNYPYIHPHGLRLVLEKATGEAKRTEYGDPLRNALRDYQKSLGPQEKTGPDALPEPQ